MLKLNLNHEGQDYKEAAVDTKLYLLCLSFPFLTNDFNQFALKRMK